ncbi:HAMP domain-containing sensor histidine kinase [Flindersiella endophytica]
MIGLLTVVSVVIGVLTMLSLNRVLIGQVDDELDRTAGPVAHDIQEGRTPLDMTQGPLVPDTLVAYVKDGEVVTAGVSQFRAGPKALSAGQRQALLELDLDDYGPGGAGRTNAAVGDLGRFRLTEIATGPGDRIIVGRSLARVDNTIVQLSVSVSMLGLAGLIAAGLVGTWIVRHSLQPLRRVARTAGRVAELPLDRGEVALAERVPAPDTDPNTEVGQVGNALNSMLDHIDAALAARQASETRVRQFVADASHELRTPLSAIRGYSEVTRRGGQEVPPDVAHAMRRVESETERMTTLVDDLLLLARLDSGRPLDREPVDLTHLVIDAVSDAHVAGPDHQWTLELPDEPVEVSGDPNRLHQVLANLLANARTHTPPGTKVTVGLANESSGNVHLTVADNGPGVPEELRPDIFERFARGDSSRSRAAGSTGLGLAIVAAVVEAHHGTVSVDSEPGRTVFTVTLPAAA